jgi:predicted ester cyclase
MEVALTRSRYALWLLLEVYHNFLNRDSLNPGESKREMAWPAHIAIVKCWFYELFAQANLALIDELLAPDFVSYDPSGQVGARGREAFKQWLRWYLASFTDAEWTLHDILEDGEKVVVRYSGLTTYRGGLFDLPSQQQRVKEMGVLIFRIREGKVAELWSALCDLDVVLALGAVPVLKKEERSPAPNQDLSPHSPTTQDAQPESSQSWLCQTRSGAFASSN